MEVLVPIIISVFSTIIGLLAVVILIPLAVKSPIAELKILILSLFFFAIVIILYIPISISGTEFQTDFLIELSEQSIRIAYLIGTLAELFLVYSLLLPNFKPIYRSIFLLSTITVVLIGSGGTLYYTVKQELNTDGSFSLQFLDPLGFLTLFLLGFIAILVILFRSGEIRKARKDYPSPFLSPLYISLFISLILLTVIFLAISFSNLYMIPINTFLVPFALSLFYFALILRRDEIFWFITNIKLETLIVMNKKSGLSIFSRNFGKNDDSENLISGILQLLNISLQELVQTQRNLEKIKLGDKTIIISTGNQISTLIISSDYNFILTAVSKKITKEFESIYKDLLRKKIKIFDTKDFHEYNQLIDKYSSYFS